MDKILKYLKKFQIKFVALFYKGEEHFIVHLTPSNISFQHMRGKKIIDTSGVAFSCRHKLLNQLNDFDIPIHLILKEWDLKVRQLNLNGIKFFDRLQAKKNFIAEEFSAQETVVCKKSSVHKNTYTIIGLQHHHQLDQVLNSIAALNKPVKKIQLFETEILHKITKIYTTKAEQKAGKWIALLRESHNRWQLLVGHSADLVYSRFLVQSSCQHFQNDLMQDVIDTMHYLPRLGFYDQQPLTLFSKQGLFQNIAEAKNNNIQLIPIMHMSDFLVLDAQKTANFHFLFSWLNDSISLPDFFWNRMSYILPKISAFILFPLVFILGITATYLRIDTAIYFKKIDAIDKSMQDFSSLNSARNAYFQRAKYFAFFQTHHQKNPILMLRKITKLTVNYMDVQSIHWMKHDQNFVLDCTLMSQKNISQKNIKTIQKRMTHSLLQKNQHLSFYPLDAAGTKIISLNISGSE
jgi:hypothetical protein